MKKALLVAMCVVMVVCLCACSNNQYKKMNKAVAVDYGEIKITVETVKGGDKLNSVVNIKNLYNKSIVSYSVETFTRISADQIPAEYKTTYVGTLEFTDGVQTSQTGDQLTTNGTIDMSKMPQEKLQFDKDYFSDAEFTDGVFTAKVLAPRQFMGDNLLSCTDMTVRFDYEADQKVLTVHYTDAKSVSVTVTYTLG